MRFEKGMDVFTAQGEKIGSLNRVVVDAKTRDVTDIVVGRGMLGGTEKVIPIGLVDAEQEDHIQLRETNQDVDDFLDYETTHYVSVDQIDIPHGNIDATYWYPPTNMQFSTGGPGMLPDVMPEEIPRSESSIPEGRVAISQGSKVYSRDDKHIGNVEQVIMDADTNHFTHFVVGKGFLLREHKLVPALWVDKVGDDRVILSVEASVFERLPDYQAD
jgi:sporulation protein YlmC with PRC-barrel domain